LWSRENARQNLVVSFCCVETIPLLLCLPAPCACRLSQGQCLMITEMCCKLQAAAAEVASENPGGIDYLVVNAGINDGHVGPSLDMCAAPRLVPALVWPPLYRTAAAVQSLQVIITELSTRRDLADFRSVFEVNVIGAFGSIQAFYPLVKVRRSCREASVTTCAGSHVPRNAACMLLSKPAPSE